jgi:protein-S-isoprenylcysteine O-methyltransferase Ste14
MLQVIAQAVLFACWVAWASAFIGARKKAAGQKKAVRAPASIWGIALQAIGFACVTMPVRPVGFEKSAPALIASMLLAPLPVALAWAATRHLGKYWRYEAALSEDHELIQTGPYSYLRHPIYTSMLGMLLATGFALTWWPMLLAALAFFFAGLEIRVRAEDRLLAGRFPEAFAAYRARVPAYIPFIR